MYRVETDRAFELAADFELNPETREKVRETIMRSLKNAKDPYMIIESKEDADLFRKKSVSRSELFIKYAEFQLRGNEQEKELSNKISDVISEIMQKEKEKGLMYTEQILLSDLPEEVRVLFENEYVTEIKVQNN